MKRPMLIPAVSGLSRQCNRTHDTTMLTTGPVDHTVWAGVDGGEKLNNPNSAPRLPSLGFPTKLESLASGFGTLVGGFRTGVSLAGAGCCGSGDAETNGILRLESPG